MSRFVVEFNAGFDTPKWELVSLGGCKAAPSFDTRQDAELWCDQRATFSGRPREEYRVVDAAPAPDGFVFEGNRCVPPVLPLDSASRKAVPVCTGCLDYAPDAIAALVDLLQSEDELSIPDSNDVLVLLPSRGLGNVSVQLAAVCLDLLQAELVGMCDDTSRRVAVRWGAALAEVARISKAGNDKHNPGEPLHHARGKSMDHADCIARHTLEEGGFDGPFRHSACRAWRALMLLQEELEAQGMPLARAAWLPDGTKGSDRFTPAVDFGEECDAVAEQVTKLVAEMDAL